MRQNGMSEQEIVQTLRGKGASQQDIENALSQTQIKEAILFPSEDSAMPQMPIPDEESIPAPSGFSAQGGTFPGEENGEMQPGIMNQEPYPFEEQEMPVPSPSAAGEVIPSPGDYSQGVGGDGGGTYGAETYPQETYPQQQGYDYNYQQQYPQGGVSADTISEIAEQVVSEKLMNIREKIEKATDLKTMAETKLFNLDERLQKIEKIIDRLQLSILQKIGEYTGNISDLKKEVIETQKSFRATRHHATNWEHKHKGHKHKGNKK